MQIMIGHFNTAAFYEATYALNRAYEFLKPAPHGDFRTLGMQYMDALDGFRSPASLESEEFRTIVDRLNLISGPDIYSRIRLLEPEALNGLMKLQLAASKLHQAANPPQGIFDSPALVR